MTRLALFCALLAISSTVQAEAPASSPSTTLFEGRPIARIEFSAGNEDVAFLQQQIDIEKGFLYSTTDISRAVIRLFSLGRFEDVRVHARAEGDSVVLLFEVLSPTVIDSTRYEGSDDPELLIELKPLLVDDARYDELLLNDVARRCRRYFDATGYPEGACEVSAVAVGDTFKVAVTVKLTRGEPLLVGRVLFVGTHEAPIDMLEPLLQLRPGQRFMDQTLRQDEKTLRLQFFERGFLLASVRSDATRSADNTVTVTHHLDADRRVIVQVQGNRLFKDEDLLADLKRAPDERLFPATLDEWRRRVLDRYRREGWPLTTAKLEQRLERKRQILHYVLVIHEGERVEVSSIVVEGAQFFTPERLTDEMLGVIDERLDVSLITRSVEHSATRDLFDSTIGATAERPLPGAPVTHPALRVDTAKIYDPEIYQAGLDSIRSLYIEQGFTEVTVGPIEVQNAVDGRSMAIRVPVHEGPRTLVGDITIVGNANVSQDELAETIRLKTQQPLTDLALEDAKLAIQRAYNRRGYLYAKVEETTRLSPDKTLAFVTLQISEGDQVRVGRVLIQGNKHTHDSVIRDRLAMKPGEPYSDDKAQQTKENLFSSTSIGGNSAQIEAFESAQVSLADADVAAERKDVIVKVVERKPQSLDFGFGISTGQGIRGFIEYTHRNMFGRAIVGSLRLSANRQLFFDRAFYGPFADTMKKRYDSFSSPLDQIAFAIERQFRAALRTPRYVTWPLFPLFYLEFSNERRNATAFSLDALSLLGGVDVLLWKNLSLSIENAVTVNRLTCSNPDGTGCRIFNASGGVRAIPQGFFLSYRAGPKLVLDLRPKEERANARHGLLAQVRADFITGRQLDTGRPYTFIRVDGQVRGYIPVAKRSSIALTLSGGNIFTIDGETQVRILANERFFLGGPTTLRGMVDQSLIPQDACTYNNPPDPAKPQESFCRSSPNGVQLNPGGAPVPPGGKFYVLAKAEYRFPIYGDLFASLFVDAGNLYFSALNTDLTDLRFNVGSGLRYAFGTTGSIVLDFGFNVSPRRALGETLFTFPYFYFGVF